MSRLLVLYNYNKYYNRIIKYKPTIQDYINSLNSNQFYVVRNDVNFNYGDGVYATVKVNIKKSDPPHSQYEHADYCVLEETYTLGTDSEGDPITTTKITRYFILDTTKVRGFQFQLSLRRDLLADYYYNITHYADVFIEKGYISQNGDPALFNKESMTYNQIKKGELLLNKTKLSGKGGGWVVGYLASQDTPTVLGPCNAVITPPANTYQYDDLPAGLKLAITNGNYLLNQSDLLYQFTVFGYCPFPTSYYGLQLLKNAQIGSGQITAGSYEITATQSGALISLGNYGGIASSIPGALITAYNNTLNAPEIWSDIDQIISSDTSLTNLSSTNYSSYNNSYYMRNGKLYRLNITQGPNQTYHKTYTGAQVTNYYNGLCTIARNYINYLIQNNSFFNANVAADTSQTAIDFTKQLVRYNVTVTEVAFDTVSVTISGNRNKNFDAPYDMFAIPLGEVNVKSNNTTLFTTPDNLALAIARAIATVGTSDRVYDIQVLPYCPFDEILNSDGDIALSNSFTEHYDYDYIVKKVTGQPDENIGIILYPKTCKGTFDLNYNITDMSTELYSFMATATSNPFELKVKSETELVRFVSPNFASQFDINMVKNGGIYRLNVDYFYKPYSPYIHVAPYFSFMYGSDYNDPKGLICSGDFSISTSASQWEKYQIENKNYEIIFNRQIQNLDVNNSIAYSQAALSSGIGVATSTLSGAGTGAAVGGYIGTQIMPGVGTAVGAAAGAIVGGVSDGVLSGLGRKYDLEYLKQQQTEARSYSVDMYAYNLGTIQALPYSLTRVSTITPNNKIFPFLEFYACTGLEKEALENKLRFNGMTVMRIDKIYKYTNYDSGAYVSGQLIRLKNIVEDSHIVAEIAKEIKEGAYYYGTNSD